MTKAMKSHQRVMCKGNHLIATVWRLDQGEKSMEAQDEAGRKLFQRCQCGEDGMERRNGI